MTGAVRISRALICECGNLKASKDAVGCEECKRIDEERTTAHHPSARIKRALAHMGWVTASDLLDAHGVDRSNEHERWAFSSAFARLLQIGELEMRRTPRVGVEYRLIRKPPAPRPVVVFAEHLLVEATPLERKAQTRRDIRSRRLAKGHCRECNEPHLPGIQLCARHKEIEAKRKRECAQRRRAA